MFPVTSASSGGAEQILYLLTRALTQAGHRSITMAANGSRVAGELVESLAAPVNGLITEHTRATAQDHHRELISTLVRKEPVDLIHFHGLDFLTYRPKAATCAELATLHLPSDWYPAHLFHQKNLAINCVSLAQANSRPETRTGFVIRNGIDLARFKFSASKSNYLLWLGRICPEKGVVTALRVARALGMPLMVAGPVHPFSDHQKYFNDEVEPLLDSDRRYLGPVGNEDRADLLSRARALLIPSLAPETSSLVAMEAAASGTPAIALRSGALPEVIDHGQTGWTVDSEEAMAAAVSRTSEINPSLCRRRAEQHFSFERMASEYLELYRFLIERMTTAV